MRKDGIKDRMKRNCSEILTITILLLAFVFLCTACGGQEKNEKSGQEASENGLYLHQDTEGRWNTELFAMDTIMTFTAYGDGAEDAIKDAAEEIRRLDALLSTGSETSEISRINANGGGTLSDDTAYLVERSLEISESTGGRFDISVYPVMCLWGFDSGEYHVPEETVLAETLTHVGADQLSYDPDSKTLTLPGPEWAIDLGGIAKGYASARAAEIFRKAGTEGALINLGGNVMAVGKRQDGKDWRIAIRHPEKGAGDYLGILAVSDKAVVTSGGYERFFEEDGVTYHHIIDPATGYPAKSGILSATAVTADGTLADGLSTSLFIMGEKEAASYWRESGLDFEMILYTEDGTLLVTEGIAENFTSELPVEVLYK